MATTMISKMFDRLVDRMTDSLYGPPLRFPATVTTVRPAAPRPRQVPDTAPLEPGIVADPGSGGAPPDDRPAGAGRHADNCVYLDDIHHACVNSYGEPVRSGQDCHHSARTESLQTFADNHPGWAHLADRTPAS